MFKIKTSYTPNNSNILNLNVCLYEDELLKVGGRLKFSNVSLSHKHQILTPKPHYLIKLLIEYYYKMILHSGTQTNPSLLRQLYWILYGQNEVKRIINKCMTCLRTKFQTINKL